MTDKTATCPICRADMQAQWRPFCSKRCADVDLGRWVTGRYAIPAVDEPMPTPGDDRDNGLSSARRSET